MAKDKETGVDPKSKDGEGFDDTKDGGDEAARRAKLTPIEGGNGNGGSMAARGEQAALDTGDEPETGEDDDGQMFVWEQGRKVTLGTLIARGTPVEHHVVFGGRRNKGSGGLRGFGEKPLLIVRGGIGPVKLVPTYDADEKVEKVAVEQHVTAKIVADAESEAGIELIAHILDAKGWARPPASGGVAV
jgi:hypothetical protein